MCVCVFGCVSVCLCVCVCMFVCVCVYGQWHMYKLVVNDSLAANWTESYGSSN